MEIIFILLPASIFLAILGLLAFFWSVKNDQFKDLETPPRKIINED